MKVKTIELAGHALDWAVAVAEGWEEWDAGEPWESAGFFAKDGGFSYALFLHNYKPSTDWSQGGPIIEQEKLCVGYQHQLDSYYTPEIDPDVLCWARTTNGGYLKYGPTLLIAAMRCYVASKLGDEVGVPDELF